MTPASNPAPVETLLIATGLRVFLLGTSLSLGLQIAFSGNAANLALENLVDPSERQHLIVGSLMMGLVSSIGAAVYLLWERRGALLHLNRITRLCSPLMLSATVPSLFSWRAFEGRDFLFVVLATLFGLALERCCRTSVLAARELGWPPPARWPSWFRGPNWARAQRQLPLVLLSLTLLAFAAYMMTHTIRQHYQLKTYSWDLGIFNNLMYNLLRGHWFKASPVLGPEGSHLQFHATFGAYLIAPIYALWQKPEMLLGIQALGVTAGAIPLYALAKLRLSSAWLALLFVYVYLVHAPLHGPLFYDFHFLTFSPTFVLAVMYFFESGSKRRLLLAWLVAISMREEVSATLAACALYYVLIGKRSRLALVGGLLSALYFLLVKFVVMPAHGQGGQSFSWIFKDLIAPGDSGFGGVLRTLATSPVFTFSKVFSADKFEYLLRTLGPVLLLVVRGRLVWLMCLPAFVFTLLSTGYEPMIQARFQYTANWTPYVIAGSLFVLDEWRRAPGGGSRFRAALPALGLTATLFSYNFGAIFQRNTFVGGFHQVEFEYTRAHRERYAELSRLLVQIPSSASVSACEMIVPHVSSRENAFTLNRSGGGGADFLLCDVTSMVQTPVDTLLAAALADGSYSFVGRSGPFAMWRKGGKHQHDAAGLRLIRPDLGTKPRSQQALRPRPKQAAPAGTKPPTPKRSPTPPTSSASLPAPEPQRQFHAMPLE